MAANAFGVVLDVSTTGEEQARRMADVINKVVGKDAQRQAKEAGDRYEELGNKIKAGFANPLGAASSAIDGFLAKLGPVGAVVTGVAAGIATVGAAGFAAAKSLGDTADAIGDLSARTGLSTRDVQTFSYAMKLAGGDIGTMDAAMKGLSKTIADNSEEGRNARQALNQLGVSLKTSSGETKDAKTLWLDLSKAFNQVGDAATGNLLAMKLFGRAGIELKADLMELAQGFDEAERKAFVFSEDDLRRMNQYHHTVVEIEEQWKRLKTLFMQPLAAVIKVTFDFAQSAGNEIEQGRRAPQASNGSEFGIDVAGIVRRMWSQNSRISPESLISSSRDYRQSVARGDAIIDQFERQRSGTAGGLQELLEGARQRERNAADELTTARGSTRAEKVEELRRKWEAAAAAVAKYEAQLKTLQSAVDPKKLREQADAAYKALRQDPVTDFFERQRTTLETLRRGGYTVESDQYINAQGTFNAELNSLLRNQPQGNRSSIGNALQSTGDYLRKTLFWFDTPSAGGMDLSKILKPDEQVQQWQQIAGIQERIVTLATGPGGELQAATKIAEIRLNSAREIAKFNDDAFAARQAEWEYELSIAEKVKSMREQADQRAKQTGGSVFDALLAGRSGIAQYGSGLGLGWARTVFGNGFAELSRGLSGRFTLPGVRDANGNLTGLGRIVDGTPLGYDPLRDAGDKQLKAAMTQLEAANLMRSAVTGKTGSGSTASLLSSIPGLRTLGVGGALSALGIGGGIFSGADPGNSMIFHGFGGTALTPGTGYLSGDEIPLFGGGSVTATRNAGALGRLGTAAVGVGAGLTAGFGVYTGLQQGGARGALTAVGSLGAAAAGLSTISSIAAFAPALGPVGGIVAAAAVVASMFLGNPKQHRAEDLANQAASRYRDDVNGVSYTVDQQGREISRDYRGGVHVYQTINLSAIDTKSGSDFLMQHIETIGEATRQALDVYPPLTTRVNQAAFGM